MHVKQIGNLTDYQDKFERIFCRSNLMEDQKLDCYLGELCNEIAWDVRLKSPRSILEATKYAQLKELSIKSNTKSGTGIYEAKRTSTRTSNPVSDQEGLLG